MRTIKCFSATSLFWICLCVLAITSCTDSSDKTLGVWYRKSDLDGPVRTRTASFVIGNYAYVCGGYRSAVKNASNDYSTCVHDVWRYDMDNDYWMKCASMPAEAERRNGAVGFSIGSKGYVTTGYDSDNFEYLKDTWEFDPNATTTVEEEDGTTTTLIGAWTRVDDFKGDARSGALAFSIGDYGYVGTGRNDDGQYKDFWRFNPNAASGSQWEEVYGFGGYKRDGSLAFVINNVAYICCGYGDSGGLTDDLWKFDPTKATETTGGWEKLRDIYDSDSDEDYDDDYTDIMRSNAAAFVIDGRAYIVTGQIASGSYRTNYWIYDPSNDLWYGEDLTPFEGTSRINAVGFSNQNQTRGFVATGETSSSRLDDVWELKPYEWEED